MRAGNCQGSLNESRVPVVRNQEPYLGCRGPWLPIDKEDTAQDGLKKHHLALNSEATTGRNQQAICDCIPICIEDKGMLEN